MDIMHLRRHVMAMSQQAFDDDDDDDNDDVLGQILTQIAPVTWGVYNEPPPDIPACGFTGHLCPEPIPGQQNAHTQANTCSSYILLLSCESYTGH